MAKPKKPSGFGNLRPGRHEVTFDHLVSGLGYDSGENNCYSPASEVKGAKYAKREGSSTSESARDQRREG